jgi:hypothetical protein
MVLPFFFPDTLILRFAGPEGAKNRAGEVLRLIQIRFSAVEFGKNVTCSSSTIADRNAIHRIQPLVRAHNEPLIVAARGVHQIVL